MARFGPQLIGETEKTLNALLRRLLASESLSESEWVTLRLADQGPHTDGLAAVVAERAHLVDAAGLVNGLVARGLLDDDQLTPAGWQVISRVQQQVAELTGPVWSKLDEQDVSGAERVLTTVTAEVRQVLSTMP